MEREHILRRASPQVAGDLARSAAASSFADILVTDPAGAAATWAELESLAPISIYQTRRWLVPWMETIGQAQGIRPIFVIGRDATRRPVVLLPLGLRRRGFLHIAGFLGGRESNANLGLFRPGIAWTRQDIAALFAAAATAGETQVDVFTLRNQPEHWQGHANPLALLPHQPSPSFAAHGALDGGCALRFSSEARKRLRKKMRRLEKCFGPVRHVCAKDSETARAILAALTAQKAARMRARGLPDPFAHASVVAFLDRAATEDLPAGEPGIELHALYAGERIVATFGGGAHGGRFSGMLNAFDADIEIAKSSPGELLLAELVAQKCAEGFKSFDLGIGEASYKTTYCPEPGRLFDQIVPVTLAGHGYGHLAALQWRIKRQIKQTPWLWAAANRLREAKRKWK